MGHGVRICSFCLAFCTESTILARADVADDVIFLLMLQLIIVLLLNPLI